MIRREAPRLAAIADALGRFPRVLVRRRQVGLFLSVDGPIGQAIHVLRLAGITARPVDVGVKGEPDLDVIVGGQSCRECGAPVHPLPAGVEVKSEDGKPRPSQVVYAREVAGRRGILHVIARTPDEALLALGLEEAKS